MTMRATMVASADASPQTPPSRLLRRTDALMIVDPASRRAEALRGLRTRLVAQHVREGRRGLALCAPAPGSGCTFVAVNLAIAMAQIGVRTVLVDTDLRGGTVGQAFDYPANAKGLGQFLGDERVRSREIIDANLIPDLSIIAAGPPVENAQELLSSTRFAAFVGQLVREYDFAVFDTTPANGCTDAQRVATLVGFSLIVARKDASYFSDIRALATVLRADGAKVVGTVLNDE